MQSTRHRQIESVLRRQGECSVEDLARRSRVSAMTIRRDLDALAQAGKVIRTHGGATLGEKVLFEFNFLQRAAVNEAAKLRIAETAATLLRDGQSVIMDSGTTTLALARQLRGRHGLTVITSSLPIAAMLQHTPGVKVLLLGGLLRPDSPDLIGALTETNLESLRADLAFVGADGVDLAGRVYNASVEVGRMLGKMAAASAITYVVADHSKVGRTALARFGDLTDWGGLITDSGLTRRHATTLRRAGVKVIVSPPASKRST